MKIVRWGFLGALAAGIVSLPAIGHAQAPGSGKSLTLGAAAVVKPKYEGSDEYDVYAIPMIIPKFSDGSDDGLSGFRRFRKRVKFRGLDDIRFRVLGRGKLEAGLVTGYIGDRDEDDGDRLRGLGDVDGGLLLGGYAAIDMGGFTFVVAGVDKVSGDDAGVQIRFAAEVDRQLSERTKVVASVGATFADDDYMQTYFGVTAAQSANSAQGLPAFNAESGIKDVHVALSAEMDLSQRWVLKAGGRYGRLLGDAADSPVIETENQFSATLGLGYKFNFGG